VALLFSQRRKMKINVFPIDASRRDDFYRVHSEANGAGWCFCVAWWTPTWEGWGSRTAEENRVLREGLFGQGEYDGYLLYVESEPAGWCQCGPRDRLTKLCGQYHLKSDPEVWALTCLLIVPRYRGIGLSQRFIVEVMKDLNRRGIKHIQGFPRRGEDLTAEDVWTGPEALFKRTGFKVERDDSKFPIYGKRVRNDYGAK
jgi:GNAT superfamily N-acetyltransferase